MRNDNRTKNIYTCVIGSHNSYDTELWRFFENMGYDSKTNIQYKIALENWFEINKSYENKLKLAKLLLFAPQTDI